MLRRFALALPLTFALAVGCATGTNPDFDEDDPSSGSGGGDGGQGGESSLCGIDCSTIVTPDCHIAVCNEGSYQGQVGDCIVVPDENGTSCDDGMFCTTDDSCLDGTCQGGPQNDCGLEPPECQDVVCTESSQTCTTQSAQDGIACENANLCLFGTTCQNGVCNTGTSVNTCAAAIPPDACHNMECNPDNGMCEPVAGNDGADCIDDTDLCSENNTCAAGVCSGGTEIDCTYLTSGCDLGICDDTNGMCTTQTLMNGDMCDDLDACTTGEMCSAGMCTGGTDVTTCSQTADDCCPSNCTAMDDIDCACSTTDFTTVYTPSTGWDGIMFDMIAVNAIEIQSFDVDIDTGQKTVEIYYKAGTYIGFNTNSGAWTLAGSAVVSPAAAGVGTPVPINVNVQIPAGQRYGFYITTTNGGTVSNGVNYIHMGPQTNMLWMSDSNLEIYGGQGQGYPFTGSSFSDRGFAGVVHYERCGS